MYIKTFKANIIVFIGYIIKYLTSHRPIIFSIRVSSMILTISLGEIKESKIVQSTNKMLYILVKISENYFKKKKEFRFWSKFQKLTKLLLKNLKQKGTRIGVLFILVISFT
jgi:hypothetical protein